VTGGGEERVRGVRKTEELIGEEVRATKLTEGGESMVSVRSGPVHRGREKLKLLANDGYLGMR
jgi:hypothetical protein